MSYERLTDEAERPKTIRDHTARWEQLQPLGTVNGDLEQRVRHFCETKGISPEALLMLEPRLRVGAGGKVEIAFAGRAPNGAVVAIKYRHLEGSSRETRAEAPSTWLQPIVAGRPDASVWLLAEGETDACRLLDLAPAGATVMVLPCGAKTFKREWADAIPRGATVYLCHDADQAGDEGADKAARLIGGKTLRLRPPVDGGDWCDWAGSREDFVELVQAARGAGLELEVVSAATFAAVDEPGAGALVGGEGAALFPINGDGMFYGDGGAGKTTLAIDLACHLAAGDPWLGIQVPRPARVLLVENEGPRPLFRGKLRRKLAAWAGSPIEERLSVIERPWGRLSFADPGCREALAAAIATHECDVAIVGPLSRSGMNEAGTLQDVAEFMELVTQVREQAGRPLALIFVHHENKGGKVSGAWEGSGDTLLHVQAQGPGKTRLHVQKARWSSEHHKLTLHLVWADGEGFQVEEREEIDDGTLAEQIRAYVAANLGTSWTKVEEAVRGVQRARRMRVRDRLFADGEIVNVVKNPDGQLEALSFCPERRPAHLHTGDDPPFAICSRPGEQPGSRLLPLGRQGGICICSLLPAL
jgi:AAA domain